MSGELVPSEGLPKAPDILGEILGFRTWRSDLDGYALHGGHGAWQPGINKATCHLIKTHRAPSAHCDCGFNAYHDINCQDEQGTYGDIFGAVVGWGKLRVAKDGWRAEYVQVVALSPGPAEFEDGGSHWARCAKLADRYGVECVAFDKLEEHGLLFADFVPESHRPQKKSKGKRPLPTPIPVPPPGASAGKIIYHHKPYVQRQYGELSSLAALAVVIAAVISIFVVFDTVTRMQVMPGNVIAFGVAVILGAWGTWYEDGT